MSAQAVPDRWQEIRGIHREYRFFYQIGGGLLLVIIGILVGGALFSADPGYQTNLYTEVLSIAVTVFILNLLAEQREERRRIRDLQERLIMEAGSTSNETAKRAIDELRHRGWLEGENSLLKDKKLSGANLQEAYLSNANLQGALLEGANLQGTSLSEANLQGTVLSIANLQEARLGRANLQMAQLWKANLRASSLHYVNLQKANLHFADLEQASLWFTDLRGANLKDANLQHTELIEVQFDMNTILPDNKNWMPDTDMYRFVDPNHPEFWRSSEVLSPANWLKLDAESKAEK